MGKCLQTFGSTWALPAFARVCPFIKDRVKIEGSGPMDPKVHILISTPNSNSETWESMLHAHFSVSKKWIHTNTLRKDRSTFLLVEIENHHVRLVAQSCPTLSKFMSCSLPGSSVHEDAPGKHTGVGSHALLQGIFPTQESNWVSCITGRFFTSWATREALENHHKYNHYYLLYPNLHYAFFSHHPLTGPQCEARPPQVRSPGKPEVTGICSPGCKACFSPQPAPYFMLIRKGQQFPNCVS